VERSGESKSFDYHALVWRCCRARGYALALGQCLVRNDAVSALDPAGNQLTLSRFGAVRVAGDCCRALKVNVWVPDRLK
jgi:hypothetical protein